MRQFVVPVLIFLVAAVAIVAGGLWLMVRSTPDTAVLSSQVTGRVMHAKKTVRSYETAPEPGFAVTYEYDADGQTFRGGTFLSGSTWAPGDTVRICYDPEDPARHASRLASDPPCGTKFYDSIQEAEVVG